MNRSLLPCSPTAHAPRPALLASLCFVLLALAAALGPQRAAAANYLVTSAADDGSAGTLRSQVTAADSAGGGTITFAPALGGQTITETQGTITLSAPITLTAPAGGVSVSGSNANTVFSITGGTSASPVILTSLNIEDGSSPNGGGVAVGSGDYAVLTGCFLTENTAFIGGGLSNSGTATLTYCTLTDNSATLGGGIDNTGTATLTGCTLTDNSAPAGQGGGLYNSGTASLTSCALTANTAVGDGGGLFNSGTASLTGCTFTANGSSGSSGQGGGIYSNNSGTATLTDDILYGDTASTDNEIDAAGAVTASHCDIDQSGYAGSNGNIDQDPKFNSEIVGGYTGEEPYGLQSSSPCIGKGITVPGLVYDIIGNPRFAPPAIGAYEFVDKTITVTSTAGDLGSGTLLTAVGDADKYTVIKFDPTVFATPQTITTDESAVAVNGYHLAIVGPQAGVTIDGGNANQVFFVGSGSGLSAIGLTIQHGNAGDAGEGGGLDNDSGTVALTGCALTANTAPNGVGGGLYNSGTTTLTACTLTANSGEGGGGLFNVGTATLTDCTFTANIASNGVGGGLYNSGTTTLTACTLTANSGEGGGGLYNDSTATLTGCTLTANTANGTSAEGGGLLNDGTATLTNDILYGDIAPEGSEVYLSGGSAAAKYCDIQGLYPATPSSATNYDFSANPDFVRAPFTNGTSDLGDLHLKSGSPCAAAGTSSAPDYLAFDLDGRPRPTPPNTSPSIGAYEAAPTDAYFLIVENTGDGSTATGVSVYDTKTSATNTVTVTSVLPMSLRADVQCADDYTTQIAAITFDPAVFISADTITETLGTLTLSTPLFLTGPAPGVSVSGNKANTVFTVTGGTSANPVTLTGLTIEDGSASTSGQGGGLNNFGTAALTDCILTANTATSEGGGLFNSDGRTATLTDCALTGNTASGDGGGLFNNGGTVNLTGCILTANSAPEGGGGLFNSDSTATLTDCVLAANSSNGSSGQGGGLFNSGMVTLTGCTFTANTASGSSGQGGGIYNFNRAILTDDILSGDTATTDSDVYGSVTASYCDIGGGYTTGTPSTPDANHDFSADPLFVSGTAPFDLHVQPGSPVVGAGLYEASAPTDITGAPRANPPTIGAYEGTDADSRTTLALATGSNSTVRVGQSAAFTATVTNISAGSTATPAGTVQFYENNTAFGSPVTLSGGTATSPAYTFTSAGNVSITATYIPSDAFVGSSSDPQSERVNEDSTTTTVSSSANPSVVGQSVTFTVTVSVNSPGVGTPTGTVSIAFGDGANGSANLSTVNGQQQATFTHTYTTAESNTVNVQYKGDANDAVSSASALTQNVNADATTTALAGPSSAAVGQSVTFTATITASSPGAGTPTGTVTFTFGDGTTSAPVTISTVSGQQQASLSHAFAAADPYSVTAAYNGSTNFAGSTSSPALTVTVSTNGTSTAVSSSANPSVVGQPVTFSASVTGSDGTPTGRVSFYLGTSTTAFDTETLVNGAAASAPQTFTAPVSGETVTAKYFGDTSNSPSSGTLPGGQTVNAVTVTGVSATWGSRTDALTAASSLLPAARKTDVPWLGLSAFGLTLSSAAPLTSSNVSVSGQAHGAYSVAVTGSGTSYTVTLTPAMTGPDILTLQVGSAAITTFTGSLPVLPGDVNDDGAVSASDIVLCHNAFLTGNVFADINGSGSVDINDYNLTRARVATTLP